MTTTRTFDESDETAISELLTGRRIVAAEQGCWSIDSWTTAAGRITLDDGQLVYVAPNMGNCLGWHSEQ